MICSTIFNAYGDHSIKRMKIEKDFKRKLIEDFFFHLHPFSDLILIVQDRQLYVDKSVLAAGSKVFQSYFQDNQLDLIEILDVTLNEMIELLQFLYPQFPCTITNDNITSLLILAYRFELNLVLSACRTFILIYLSQLKCINGNLIEQKDGTRVPIESMIEILSIWYREFFLNDDHTMSNRILQTLVNNCLSSKILDQFEEKIQWRIYQARVKFLEHQLTHH